MDKRYSVTIVLRSGHVINYRIRSEAGESARDIGLEMIKRWKGAMGLGEWLEILDGVVRCDDIAAMYLGDITDTVKLEEMLAR